MTILFDDCRKYTELYLKLETEIQFLLGIRGWQSIENSLVDWLLQGVILVINEQSHMNGKPINQRAFHEIG